LANGLLTCVSIVASHGKRRASSPATACGGTCVVEDTPVWKTRDGRCYGMLRR